MAYFEWQFELADLSETRLFAQLLALKLGAGDIVWLCGDLGAGKTTFARDVIRALLGDGEHEVPSPTYQLMLTYETPRFVVRHADLYRLASGDELSEIGLLEDTENAVLLIEWPERVAEFLPAEKLTIKLSEAPDGSDDRRIITVSAGPASAPRLARVRQIWHFLWSWMADAGLAPKDLEIAYFQGDASARHYARLRVPNGDFFVMDCPPQPDGPAIRDGLAYSQIAHLAEDIAPFIAIGAALGNCGLSVPETQVVAGDQGLAIIEDLGDRVFGDVVGAGADLKELYRAACDVLLDLRQQRWDRELCGHGCRHVLPRFDLAALSIEVELLLDWYLTKERGVPVDRSMRDTFLDAWRPQFARLGCAAEHIVLRDFHSPNLIWMPDRKGVRRVGLLDYQDALRGPAAYDLVSLLQDARLDVPTSVETELFDYYCNGALQREADFDVARFKWAYALLGAQRNAKILGIFARLSHRDGKPQYLRHIPRVTEYLWRNLDHPELAEIRTWFGNFLARSDDGQN